ncbi:DUF445 family protein [Actinokineospora globicatena]|uniref:DUF445 family protein n=1 Tax=Actinokineospora globicatena TaxID=103729 RepID=UPI0020A60C70|nr:DUF445 family protein [Actinokineospora globicatena]MCP2300889.1 Protein of unknown function (DUF445) [Actinokineospora globicatena]GLW77485.1 hypothetical protein Aglo01_19670 [Actinokineospora globicatena]GLW84319.1 hypothetical protein Aglo02_19590 [Actinokineospora globicatena]
MDWAAIGADLREHWLVYLSMPVVAAVIGYVTKRAAIEMMFRPLEFVGVWRLGWQGVIPRNAERMATVAMELMTTNLIAPREVFGRLDPKRVADELRGPIERAVDEIARDVLAEYQPNLWELLPRQAQDRVLGRIRREAPAVVERLMREVAQDIEALLDVKAMAVRALVRDKAVLNRLIRGTAAPEMRFIARSGIWFGLVIGVVQLVTWALTKNPWVLPVFGGITGWLTDWLALKMIFFPRLPRRFLGLVTWQGMFQRRRMAVARDYGELIAGEILTVANVLEAVLTGPGADRLHRMVEREVRRSIDEQASLAKPLVVAAVGSRRYQEMKAAAARRAIEHVPETVRHIEGYATGALDIRATIVRQIQGLNPVQYEGLLRPAFRQDEWKLITVGAVIGFLVGELQLLVLLH